MSEATVTGIILILVGLFSLVAALFDWDWFMENRRARFFVRVMGRTGARIFYGLLGVAIAMMGVFGLFSS